MSEQVRLKCFCCDRVMDGNIYTDDPTVVSNLYSGLFFRASGNYGSVVFNPMPDDGFLQIVICDECIKEKTKRVTRIYNIKTRSTADIQEFEI